jgi:TPR repeat protein
VNCRELWNAESERNLKRQVAAVRSNAETTRDLARMQNANGGTPDGRTRLVYQRTADAGDPAAAFALAETFDPQALAEAGIPPDTGLARTWYARARDMGFAQAAERLERLKTSE